MQRFVDAQDSVIDRVIEELRDGHKRSHWMWFVFPQLAGLGRSSTARRYALSGLAEARAYLEHPVLGPRLRECCQALLGLATSDPVRVLGDIDAVKLRSSMTLFAHVGEPLAVQVLDKYYAGAEDPLTVGMLAARVRHED